MSFRFSALLASVVCVCLFLGANTAEARPRFDRVIIDPGHGGKDRGAIWGGVEEAKLNMLVAKRLEKMLKAKGIPVTMTRRSDVFVKLPRRAAIANRYKRSVFVSIHFNAFLDRRVHGAETFYYGTQGKVLAYEIQRQLIGLAKMKDRKIRKRPFVVLVKTRCPAVLVECGYISNSAERAKCKTPAAQQLFARSIFNGLMAYRN